MRSLKMNVRKLLFPALSFCPLWVSVGDTVQVTVRWDHEVAPGVKYTYRIGPQVITEPGIAEVTAEGHPTGCTWTLNGHEVIFYDGVESGDTGRWE